MSAAPTPSPRHPSRVAFLVALSLLACCALGFGVVVKRYGLMLKKEPIYPASNRLLSSLPAETTSWQRVGTDRRESAEVEETLGTANYVSRVYLLKDAKAADRPMAIDFHAAYYTGMIDTVPHVADRCFVGAGMSITRLLGAIPLPLSQENWSDDTFAPAGRFGQPKHVRSYEGESKGTYVHLPNNPHTIALNVTKFADKSGAPLYSGYFFIANGTPVSNAEGVRLMAFDLKSKYAYYLKLQFTSSTVHSGEELATYAAKLLDEIFPEVLMCVPDWVDVESGSYPRNALSSTTPEGAKK